MGKQINNTHLGVSALLSVRILRCSILSSSTEVINIGNNTGKDIHHFKFGAMMRHLHYSG
jgi:hypothetical protein